MIRKILLAMFFVVLGAGGAWGTGGLHIYADSSNTWNLSVIDSLGGLSDEDTLIIHPGTYQIAPYFYEVYGTAESPIVIRGSDPDNRPVFDLEIYEAMESNSDVYYFASTYGQGPVWTGGNWGQGAGIAPTNCLNTWWNRGCFTLYNCGYVYIEDIEVKNAQSHGGATNGIRACTDDGPIRITRCKITHCCNGIDAMVMEGSDGLDTVFVSYCEIAYNGRWPKRLPLNSPGGHNVYTHGGAIVIEHSYIHDAWECQNLHLRNSYALVQYCWLENPSSYHIDQCGINYGTLPDQQIHTYLGNVFVDGQANWATSGNIFTVMEGTTFMQGTPTPQRLNLYYNTFYGMSDSRWLVCFSGIPSVYAYRPSLYMYNNIIYRTGHKGNASTAISLIRCEYPRDALGGYYDTMSVRNNWLHGTEAHYDSFLAGQAAWPNGDGAVALEDSAWFDWGDNIIGTNPGFTDTTVADYTLADGSAAIGLADPLLGSLPFYEYADSCARSARAAWADVGAYEYGDEIDAVCYFDIYGDDMIYPRRSVVHWTVIDFWDDDDLREIAKADMVAIQTVRAYTPNAFHRAVWDSLRSYNPDIKILGYCGPWETAIIYSAGDTSGWCGLSDGALPFICSWDSICKPYWMYTNTSDTMCVWENGAVLNFITVSGLDTLPNRALMSSMADVFEMYQDNSRWRPLDGLLFDYFTTSFYQSAGCDAQSSGEPDFDGDGTVFDDDANEQDLLLQYQRELVDTFRARFGDDFVLVANGLQPITDLTMRPKLNGVFYENWPYSMWGWTGKRCIDSLISVEEDITSINGKSYSIIMGDTAYESINTRIALLFDVTNSDAAFSDPVWSEWEYWMDQGQLETGTVKTEDATYEWYRRSIGKTEFGVRAVKSTGSISNLSDDVQSLDEHSLVGAYEERQVFFTNLAPEGYDVLVATLSGLEPPFASDSASVHVAPGDTSIVTITFAPSAVGLYTDTLVVDCDCGEIILTGEASLLYSPSKRRGR